MVAKSPFHTHGVSSGRIRSKFGSSSFSIFPATTSLENRNQGRNGSKCKRSEVRPPYATNKRLIILINHPLEWPLKHGIPCKPLLIRWPGRWNRDLVTRHRQRREMYAINYTPRPHTNLMDPDKPRSTNGVKIITASFCDHSADSLELTYRQQCQRW